MSLIVKFYSLFKINLKSPGVEYELEGETTISKLIKKLDQDFDGYFSQKLLESDGSIASGSIILVNGHNVIHLEGLKTEIDNQDTVTLFPPSAGG